MNCLPLAVSLLNKCFTGSKKTSLEYGPRGYLLLGHKTTLLYLMLNQKAKSLNNSSIWCNSWFHEFFKSHFVLKEDKFAKIELIIMFGKRNKIFKN